MHTGRITQAMKYKWLEPLKAKRAREGGFTDIFQSTQLYLLIGGFMVLFLIILLGSDVEPGNTRAPLPVLFFYLFLIAVSASFVIRLIYWIAPATIHVDDFGIHYQLGSGYRTDQWEDISEVRIVQRAGWMALAYTVKGTAQREWGISAKIPAHELMSEIQGED